MPIYHIYLPCLVAEKNDYTIQPVGYSHIHVGTEELMIYALKLKLSVLICRLPWCHTKESCLSNTLCPDRKFNFEQVLELI